MLDGLLGRSNFKTKCKSALTRTKTRLEVIKKKRNAMQRFLKKDIADLLSNNLDRNAYGRAEGLYIELNLSSCYDYVEECCTCIGEHLKELHKQRECLEECKVAASSLTYAAARFADLPELRDLRNQFNDRYGKSLETFVCKEFIEKLKSKFPTTEMKLRLMQDIAQEFSVAWDPKPLEQHLQSSPMSTHGQLANDDQNLPRSKSVLVQAKEKQFDSNKPAEEECPSVTGTRMRQSQSCSKLQEHQHKKTSEPVLVVPLSSAKSDSEDNAYQKPFINRIVPAPYTITGSKDDEGSTGKARNRPRSVRTKFLNPALSSVGSSPGTPCSATSLISDGQTPMSDLPLPPGKRRYLFPETPLKEADDGDTKSDPGKSKFLPPKDEHELPKTRHVKSASFQSDGHVHPKMPDFDELAERMAALRKV